MKIKNLFIYPIKSFQGISINKAIINSRGLRDFEQPFFTIDNLC